LTCLDFTWNQTPSHLLIATNKRESTSTVGDVIRDQNKNQTPNQIMMHQRRARLGVVLY